MTTDLEDKTERQYENIAAVAAVAAVATAAAAAATAADGIVAPLIALLAETTTVAPSFVMLVEAAVAVALVTTNIANAYNLYATSRILGNQIIMS